MGITNVAVKIKKNFYYYATISQRCWRNVLFPVIKPKYSRPIFIIGCSRSGTTAVYKTLSMAKCLASLHKESHDFWNDLHPPGETNWESHVLGREQANRIDQDAASRFFYRYVGARRFVDKANQNCFRIPYLNKLFPDAMFVYVKRDGRDNINSLIHGWDRPDEFGSWSQGLPAKVRVDNGAYMRWCFFLFPGWRSYLNSSIEEVCARQWVEANRAILIAKDGIQGHRWVEIFYEGILSSPIETFQNVFRQLDLQFDDVMKHHCESMVKNPYNAFSTPRLHKWRDENRERIERILPIISDTMTDLGYA